MKYKINIFILLLCVLILINVGCKNKGGTSASTGKPASESSNNNAVSQLEQYDAPNLLSMGNSAIGEAMSEGIPEYSFNKALNYFYQVVTKFSDSYEAVEAQYNIAKYTEKKIKLLNMREIEIRKKQNVEKSLEFEELKPFLQSYI
ncbi:hypothetical protein KA977_14305, partial [Candidatus Dependentiae bacterium]|nr:hypothetical protein [Candidatus Dependentiae bacterium]